MREAPDLHLVDLHTPVPASSATKLPPLQVSYLNREALVRVNGARAIPFKQTPSNMGQVYENGGARLARSGNQVIWNTSARSAAENCGVINTIN